MKILEEALLVAGFLASLWLSSDKSDFTDDHFTW